ncbi:MFS transporter [Kineococcus sp. SYSU DK002]|uniref:MFS transporter n=1 Tax=Kineococcus sp. SYSU DK002 TaxID=3383123 RepID=UPI003D7ECF54
MLTAFFAAAAWGRVGLAATPLALLWLVHDRTGSWGPAGLATAGLALAEAVVGPQTARLADRWGQTRVLLLLAAAHGLAAAVVLGTAGPGTTGVLALAAGFALGASLPQLGAFSAARWSHRLGGSGGSGGSGGGGPVLARAFGWEALAGSTAFVLGPVLASALAATGRSGAALLGAGALVVSGAGVLAALRGSAPPAAPPAARRSRVGGRPRGARAALAVNALLGVHFGALPLAVAAGHPAAATALFAASSCGGLLAALVLTRRPAPRRAAGVLAGGAALLLVPWPVPVLALVLLAVGATLPPVVVAAAVRARETAGPGRLTGTFAWLASASAAGGALGAALAGQGVERAGPAPAFALAAAALAVVPVVLARPAGGRGGPRTRLPFSEHDGTPEDL